ncbi:hypothetical protein Peur_043642 [Populus x canadensis]
MISTLAASIEGWQVHAIVCRTGFGSNNDFVLWNEMISEFAKHACSLEAMNLFEEMQQMVHEAHELMKRMPFVATASMWGSHLVACRIHGNLELAEIAAKNLFEMEP